jgi:sterol desaturase/sphingolipid hydroxylase (fatty acid hydroxylase superfamily)
MGRLCFPAWAKSGVDKTVDFINVLFTAWRSQASDPGIQCVLVILFLALAFDIARKGWRLSWLRRAVASVAATVAIFHVNLVLAPGVWLLSEQLKALYSLLGIPSVPGAVWAGLPVWALSLVAILAHDFANYWNHRAKHMKWLWPVHAIHHSDPDVNALTTYRIHALETLVMWGSYTIMLTWLGLPAGAIGIGALILLLHNAYVHVDIDWDHGPLRMLIASPRFHRWHHADVPEAYGKNLANVFPFFDWLFGTYRVPGPCNAPLGATGIPRNDPVRLALWPLLEWARLATQSVTARRAGIAGWLARGAGTAKSGLLKVDAE